MQGREWRRKTEELTNSDASKYFSVFVLGQEVKALEELLLPRASDCTVKVEACWHTFSSCSSRISCAGLSSTRAQG